MSSNNSISVVALICGILGVIGTFIYQVPLIAWILFLCAIAGIVTGAIGMKKSKAASGKASGLAVAGLVCVIVGVVFGITGVACSACVCAAVGPLGCLSPNYQQSLESAAYELADYLNSVS